MKLLGVVLLLLLFITWSLGQVYNPTITRMEALSPTSITLRWSQRTGSPSSYEITYNYIGPCDGVTDSGRIPVNEVPEPLTGSVERNLTGLQEFSSYSISVVAIYDEGSDPVPRYDQYERSRSNRVAVYEEDSDAATTTIVTLPAAPSAGPGFFKTTAVGPAVISIQWGEVPCVERNSQIVDYQVHYSDGGNFIFDLIGTAERMTTIRGLAPQRDYLIQVAAVGNNTQSGTFSEPLIVQTSGLVSQVDVPGPVTSLAADSRVTSVILTWDAPSSGTVTEYQVDYYLVAEVNEQGLVTDIIRQGLTILTEDTSVEITELWPGTTYSVMVRTTNDAGAGNTVAIQATTENISRVQNVQASADPLNDTAVMVTWSSLPADSIPLELLFYTVYYNILSSTECPLDVTLQEYYPSDVTSVTISDLEREQLYVFQVAARVEVDGEVFVGERSLLNEGSVARTGGSGRDTDDDRGSDEEERSDGINYGALVAIVVGTFAVTALFFTAVLVASLIHWRRKNRTFIEEAKTPSQRQAGPDIGSTNSIPVKACAAYGVTELHAEDMDTSTNSYSYIDIENTYEN